ncbi:MAG: PBP1A family penicillin-binding protein [Treponema sp.]|jgi:penicillin-binding protein 1A|nr:PBP1A family penicillin-binding protein [Treponema sp.]
MGVGGKTSIFSVILIRFFAVLTVLAAVVIGIGLGLSLAETTNVMNLENFQEFNPALPTKILDINGTLITEFAADEKRELVSLNELPRHLIYAVLAREDPDFYNHRGFSIRAISRAAVGRILGKNWGGGSTITQQVAGTLYTDRTEMTLSRKIRELWWAFQMERRYTKNEILEIYLNYMIMGPGTYGVEAASQYFFGHSAREITLAEAAILVVQLSSPSRYNPLNNPNEAMDRQLAVLTKMIELGYASQEEADASFDEYWSGYDYTRASTAAYYNREDAAPWFSEYVRRELEDMMYGTMDYYRDGYTVHTTLNLNHQEAAVRYMRQGLEKANREYQRSNTSNSLQAINTYTPIVELLSLCFDLDAIHASGEARHQQRAMNRYVKVVNPVVDMAALVFGIQDLKGLTNAGYGEMKTDTEQNVVEGALISIENETGYITAIVGGSKYDESNQLIRATQGNIQPGSSFKPLYYSAAIDSRKFNPTSLIYDVPIVFHNEDGTPYIPLNFRGEWKGSVLLYEALAQSMNVASLRVLDSIGFDSAINRAAALLDITDPEQIRRTFPRVYPLGLGIISTSPLRMARAFAVFANQGRSVTPIAIRSVENRNGLVVLDPERELRLQQRLMGESIQVISPQNAYVMTSMLKKTVEVGTLYNPSAWGSKFTFKDENGKSFRMPMAGKTGTPQNWSDAWTVGFSPYYTTALWFGFDKPGNSLGVNLTGSTLAGPVWADYMREIHQGLPYREFVRPATGVIDVTVCAKSGLLKTASCNEGEVTLPFLEGTQPSEYCDIHGATIRSNLNHLNQLNFAQSGALTMGDTLLDSLSLPVLPPGLGSAQSGTTSSLTSRAAWAFGASPSYSSPAGTGNRLLDGDDFWSSQALDGSSSAPAQAAFVEEPASGPDGDTTEEVDGEFSRPPLSADTSPEEERAGGMYAGDNSAGDSSGGDSSGGDSSGDDGMYADDAGGTHADDGEFFNPLFE